MLKGILGFLLFVFVLAVFIVMLVGGYVLRKIREFRKAAKDAADQQAFYYRNETGRQRQQYNNQNTRNSQGHQSAQNTQQGQGGQNDEPRRTQTVTGETIIDHRRQKGESKKIFDDSDGEYVEFEEG